ncbi:anhydro-N-acetylmuramic acid kinase [Piscinibacter koreensis]|uniref:Anhydro-N-acetylmuramic acid kinase n=1 Tax=Piscinibacter koreensis TaxID=2742824 RepID=A0A7Y6NLX8_9BURK|nr:anhydro-N-acetylmuramic acid kinase [Schlegelella koreensis]NUZ05590.1 anhydro-N-acetylmuramic acid kinase [Schlegelella koreensis]
MDGYIGLMSGTSLDGVDGVLATFDEPGAIEVRAHAHRPFDPALRSELLALNRPGADELHRAALAGNALAALYAEIVEALLAAANWPRHRVRAIGAHGQTVRHRPGEFDGIGYTLQLNAPALLAERSGIDVVADFRSRDVAARGQGAPLVPAFHRALFGRDADVAVLNLGGIANLTLLGADGGTLGFDCGPANALLDGWCERHRGEPFDRDGAWAASGRVDAALLQAMLADPYFALAPPKSTGRDRFNAEWLERQLAARLPGSTNTPQRAPADVQATLAELTARSCADALRRHAPGSSELIVCGGGAFNGDLMQRLQQHLHEVPVVASSERGLPPTQVEAAAFAWLARAFVERRPGNLSAVTGAAGERVLGALYPAG